MCCLIHYQICYNELHRYQSPLFEVTIPIEVQKVGFQNRAGEVNFRKEDAPVYVFGTRGPDFPNSLQMRCRICYNELHRYQCPLFEVTIPIEVQKVGFQNRAGEVNFRKEDAPVYVIGTRVPDFPNSLQMRCRICYNGLHRYQSPLFEVTSRLDEFIAFLQVPIHNKR